MGQTAPIRPIAIVVEDDASQRDLLAALLEESEMRVIECENAEAAIVVLRHHREAVTFLFIDVKLAGPMDGLDLARFARDLVPGANVLLTSGSDCSEIPRGTKFMPKPWRPLDVLIEAERSIDRHHPAPRPAAAG